MGAAFLPYKASKGIQGTLWRNGWQAILATELPEMRRPLSNSPDGGFA